MSNNLDTIIKGIEKEFGAGAVVKLGDKVVGKHETISTGSFGLDIALGTGGLVKGRIVEIYGENSSGKSTLSLHVIANCQKLGGLAALIDAEYAFDREYAASLGVDVDNLYVNQPAYTEEGLTVCERLIDSGEFSVIVIDSVAALVPKKELEGEIGDSAMGIQARLMSQALRKITGKVSKTNTLVIFINQTREKIGIMFGSPITTTSGKALAFYASVRLDISKTTQLKAGEEIIGNRIKVKVVKNKLSPPFRKAEFNLIFGKGIDKDTEVIEVASELGIISKTGAWLMYDGTKVQGSEKFKQLLCDNEGLREEIEAKIKAKLNENI